MRTIDKQHRESITRQLALDLLKEGNFIDAKKVKIEMQSFIEIN